MYAKRKTRFTTLVRIDPKQLAWLKENKDTRTVAGFLDKIINDHKKVQLSPPPLNRFCYTKHSEKETHTHHKSSQRL